MQKTPFLITALAALIFPLSTHGQEERWRGPGGNYLPFTTDAQVLEFLREAEVMERQKLTFVHGHQDFGHEILYFLGDRLVCAALVDVLPRAVSAVYAFYDPELRSRSLGVYSILRQIAFARERGVSHLYLGYWIEDCASMSYKANYGPHQILEGRPELDERPDWDG